MARVKICGLTREADVEVAATAGADAVGVVCDVPVDTPREVPPERAAALLAAAPPFVTTVLVTMPADPDRAVDLVERVGPDAVQIHGGLEPDALADLREAVDARVLYAVGADDLASAAGGEADPASGGTADGGGNVAAYDEVADALVVDSLDADGGGGTGRTHDWSETRAATAALSSPIVLAGGLAPGNVAEAIRTVEPYAVDVASGVEERGGEKSAAAVRSFVERATGARRAVAGGR